MHWVIFETNYDESLALKQFQHTRLFYDADISYVNLGKLAGKYE